MRVQGVKRNEKLTAINTTVNSTGGNLPKKRIHNVFIIDASGSMRGGKYNNAISGLQEILNSINIDTDTDNTVTVVEFEEDNISRRIDFGTKVTGYIGMGCGGQTPLNEAVGETLEYIIKTRKKKFDVDDKVLVNVFTDGMENHSGGKWRGVEGANLLGKIIKDLEDNHGFTVTFVGTKSEVNYAVSTLNLATSNTLVHTNTADSVMASFGRSLKARQVYSKSVSRGEDVKVGFYTKTMEEEEDSK